MTTLVCKSPARAVAEEALLLGALIALLVFRPAGQFGVALAIAIPIVIAWAVWTIHFPARVELSDEGISFSRFGRTHSFAWQSVDRVSIRRFLVRDRVLVRLAPASAFAGKYWLFDSMDGYEHVVAQLEERARSLSR